VTYGYTPILTGFADIGQVENVTGYTLGYNSWQQTITNCINAEAIIKGAAPSGIAMELEFAGPGAGQVNPFPSSQGSWNANHYRGARAQAAICMGLQWQVGISCEGAFIYIDELNAGAGKPGWLGAPSVSVAGRLLKANSSVNYTPPTAAQVGSANATAAALAWNSYGIMTFPFANGTVYLNPPTAGNVAAQGAKTLPAAALQNGGGHHISYPLANSASGGNGAPPNGSGGFVPNGAAFTSLYIQGYDAVFTKP
jgi:hypothetical protein